MSFSSGDVDSLSNGKTPTVLQVLPALEVGGVERGTVDITAGLTGAGWQAVVASSGGAMTEEVKGVGGIHVTLPLDRKNPWTIRRNVRVLQKVIREYRVDIVHARSRAPAWSARTAARRSGVPFVTTFHGVYGCGNRLKKAYNSIMAKGDIVIAVSEFVSRHVQETYRTPSKRLWVIHRGIDTGIFNPEAVSDERMIMLARQWGLPDDAPVIMLPGRAARLKGHTVMIEAVRNLDRGDVRVLLVGVDQGKPRYRDELEAQIRKAGLEGVVRLTKPCRDMAAAYMLADLVVSASIEPEAFGRVAVEAQAMGRPLVATDLGGSRETVIDRRTGRLVPAGDASALADAMGSMLTLTTGERRTLARRARDHVMTCFTKSRMCDRTLSVYRELLEAPSARNRNESRVYRSFGAPEAARSSRGPRKG